MTAVAVNVTKMPNELITGRMKPTAAATTRLRAALEIRLREAQGTHGKGYSHVCSCHFCTARVQNINQVGVAWVKHYRHLSLLLASSMCTLPVQTYSDTV
jgi:hypothetical protein